MHHPYLLSISTAQSLDMKWLMLWIFARIEMLLFLVQKGIACRWQTSNCLAVRSVRERNTLVIGEYGPSYSRMPPPWTPDTLVMIFAGPSLALLKSEARWSTNRRLDSLERMDIGHCVGGLIHLIIDRYNCSMGRRIAGGWSKSCGQNSWAP